VTETAIRNIRIGEFQLTEDFQPEGKTDWQRQTYSVAGAAWYGDPKEGTFRLNISREVNEWEPFKGDVGAAAKGPRSVESTYDIAYDGKTGRDRRIQDGRWPITHVYPGYFPELEDRFHRYATGIEFCLSYPQPATFGKKFPGASAYFQAATEFGEKMNLEGTKLDGRDAIKVFEATPLQGSVAFWFDPHHGYALIGYERVFQGELQESERVTSFAEAAPGVWYPASGYYEEPTRDAQAPKGRHRSSFTAKNIVANDPAFNTSIFTIDTSSSHTDIIKFPSVDKASLPPPAPGEMGKQEAANRSKSADNLLNIGGLLGIYANDFHRAYPPDFATAAKVEDMGSMKFRSPMGDAATGYDYVYLYFPGMADPLPHDQVVAYDAPDAAHGHGASVLFGDGNVRWLDAAALKVALENTKAKIAKAKK
jgi:prepilin-type processing-associated H-X9-DG protein